MAASRVARWHLCTLRCPDLSLRGSTVVGAIGREPEGVFPAKDKRIWNL